ncbi:MAG: nuclear transport factor 2 family protein [Planctomycetota bacterium]|nr:nuclear transport factor 2 family protein [Planctomycetota bacterium]
MIQILSLAILLLLLSSPVAWCSDVDDLKAAVVNEYNAWARRDCKAVVGMHTDPSVQYTAQQVKPTVHSRDETLKNCEAINPDVQNRKVTPVDLQYQVFGTTGIVYGRIRYEATLKDGSAQSGVGRRLETWVKTEGKWLRAAVQLSAVPSGD